MPYQQKSLVFEGPFVSDKKYKKFYVLVFDKKRNKFVRVDFGDTRYEDYTQHKDKKRRENYLKRASAIVDKFGKKTKDNPFSPNFWSIRYLWDG